MHTTLPPPFASTFGRGGGSYRAAVLLTACVAAIGLVSAASAQTPPVHANAESVEPLRVGQPIPSVNVRSIDGEPVDLAKRMGDSGALLVFYRGGW